MAQTITLPVGRIVQGDPYRANDKDMQGNPLTVKNGPNVGKPKVEYFFALAIPKGPEAAQGPWGWTQTEWGKVIYQEGFSAFPQLYQTPTFAWKVEDGDSITPNRRGRKNAETEGMAGHWIVNLKSGFPVPVHCHDGQTWKQRTDPFVKCGYFVQVQIDVSGNNNAQNPGVYLNPKMIAFNNYGPEIFNGPDPNAAGFAAPVANAASVPPAGPVPPMPGAGPVAPAIPQMPVGAPMPAAAGPTAPYPQIRQPPVAAPMPAAPVAMPPMGATPAAPPVPVMPAVPAVPQKAMTAKAQQAGYTYAALQAQGWTDAQMVQHGYLQP